MRRSAVAKGKSRFGDGVSHVVTISISEVEQAGDCV